MKKLCTLCKCEPTGMLYGFPVCDYHKTHGEDDPSCPVCNHPADVKTSETEQAKQVVAVLAEQGIKCYWEYPGYLEATGDDGRVVRASRDLNVEGWEVSLYQSNDVDDEVIATVRPIPTESHDVVERIAKAFRLFLSIKLDEVIEYTVAGVIAKMTETVTIDGHTLSYSPEAWRGWPDDGYYCGEALFSPGDECICDPQGYHVPAVYLGITRWEMGEDDDGNERVSIMPLWTTGCWHPDDVALASEVDDNDDEQS